MLILILTSMGSAYALDLQGSARVYRGSSSTDGANQLDQDYLNQFYNLSLTQSIGPWLSLELSYLDTEFRTETDTQRFDRTTRTPSIQLLYNRPNFSAFLQYSEIRNRSTDEFQNLDLKSALATFTWKPDHGPLYSLRLRQDTNRSLDVSTFGRDIRNRNLNFGVHYEQTRWSAAYEVDRLMLDNRGTGLEIEQLRHDLRGSFRGRYWGNRIDMTTSARVSLANQDQKIPVGTVFGEPVPVTTGLYALDSTPDLGSLNPAAGLVDGDISTPARTGTGAGDPIIQIGGANTNQNLGLDLTFIRPVTRLQVHVNAVSDPSVFWEVYESADNFTWTRIAGTTSLFDQAFLRYEIRFPQRSNRFFKLVNITLNSQATVAVTEVLAFLDLTVSSTQTRKSDADRYQLNAGFSITPFEKMTADFQFMYNQNQSALGGTVGRRTVSFTYDASMNFLTSANTNLKIQYRLADFEQRRSPQVFNTEDIYTATFFWTPLPTVETQFIAYQRVEKDRGVLLRKTDSLQARAFLELLPTLTLRTEASANSTDDPFSGFQQTSYRIAGDLESRLTRDLTLTGSLSQEWFDFTSVVDLDQRTTLELFSTWRANLFVTITARLGLRDETRANRDQRTVNQRYTLNWSPGSRLATTVFYQDTDDDLGSRITSSGAGLSYKVNSRFTLFANGSLSRTETGPLSSREVTNVLAGLILNF